MKLASVGLIAWVGLAAALLMNLLVFPWAELPRSPRLYGGYLAGTACLCGSLLVFLGALHRWSRSGKLEPEQVTGFAVDARAGRSPGVALRKRLAILLQIWIIALFLACPHPRLAQYFVFFPLGLAFLVQRDSSGWPDFDNVFLTIAWVGYVTHGIVTLTTPSKRVFYVLCGLLVFVLVLNVKGCNMMLPNERFPAVP